MYNVSIIMLGSQQISLQFKTDQSGIQAVALIDAAFSAGEPEMVPICDDYGRRGALRLDEIAGYFGCSVEQALKGNGEAQMIQAEASADLQSAALRNPKLKSAANMAALLTNGGRTQ